MAETFTILGIVVLAAAALVLLRISAMRRPSPPVPTDRFSIHPENLLTIYCHIDNMLPK